MANLEPNEISCITDISRKIMKHHSRYSLGTLVKGALSRHQNWKPAWTSPPLKSQYDVVIIGGGGHGLATAFYLAKEHGIRKVTVLEKNWIGGGNSGRNTAVIRSNYLREDSIRFFDKSVQLYETLSRDLNYNIMFSQRSEVDVLLTNTSMRNMRRRALNMNLQGVDFKMLAADEVRRRIPVLAPMKDCRLPILGGSVQERAGIARHDAIVWGYARAASAYGVDIIQNINITGIRRGENGKITGLDTDRGHIKTNKIATVAGGENASVAEMVDIRLPLQTFNLQAFVSEPIKPVLDVVVNCPDLEVYLSHSDKGELVIGGITDAQQISFRRGGKLAVLESTISGLLELFPTFRRLKLMRQWGGSLEFARDGSPIVSNTSVNGFYVSAGWWGGFKAIPAGGLTLAHTIAKNEPHPLSACYRLDRFDKLNFLMEGGTTVPIH